MFNFIHKITEFILGIQEKLLPKTFKQNSISSYSNKSTKRVYSSDASVEFTSKTNSKKLKLETEIVNIIKRYDNNPEKLLRFIQNKGTKVYRIPFAAKILNIIHYEEGFISETQGLKALYLNFITNLFSDDKMNYSFKTEPMFILDNSTLDSYQMIHLFYKWYSYKLDMPGFNYEAQNSLQEFLTSTDNNVKDFEINEILELKEAIARDVESINFVMKIARASEGSKNALGKMKLDGAMV